MKKLSKLAVDIVLIPPHPIRQLAIELNREISSKIDSDFFLNHQTCIPHISLLMGGVQEKRLEELQEALQLIADKMTALQLTIPAYVVSALPNKKYVSSLLIEKNRELQNLHETLFKRTKLLLTHDRVSKEMFFQGASSIQELSISWVKQFLLNSSKKNFQPHITLGLGEVTGVSLPIKFKASELALCQLGNYCTCRKKLWSSQLNS